MSSSGGTQKTNQNRRPFFKGQNDKGKNAGNNKPQLKKPDIKKKLKFHLHGVGKEKQTATYSKVLEKICLRIQQSYRSGSRVAKSLLDEKKVPLERADREVIKIRKRLIKEC